MKAGILFRWQSFWVGVHYSKVNRRFCINVLPWITIWITLIGGRTPNQNRGIEFSRMLEARIRKFNQLEGPNLKD